MLTKRDRLRRGKAGKPGLISTYLRKQTRNPVTLRQKLPDILSYDEIVGPIAVLCVCVFGNTLQTCSKIHARLLTEV